MEDDFLFQDYQPSVSRTGNMRRMKPPARMKSSFQGDTLEDFMFESKPIKQENRSREGSVLGLDELDPPRLKLSNSHEERSAVESNESRSRKNVLHLEEETFGRGEMMSLGKERKRSQPKENKDDIFNQQLKLTPPPFLDFKSDLGATKKRFGQKQQDPLRETLPAGGNKLTLDSNFGNLTLPSNSNINAQSMTISALPKQGQKQSQPKQNVAPQAQPKLPEQEQTRIRMEVREQCEKSHRQRLEQIVTRMRTQLSLQREEYQQLMTMQKQNGRVMIEQLNSMLKAQRETSREMIKNQQQRLNQLHGHERERARLSEASKLQQLELMAQKERDHAMQISRSYELAREVIRSSRAQPIVIPAVDYSLVEERQNQLQRKRQDLQRQKQDFETECRMKEEAIAAYEHKTKMALLDQKKYIELEKTRLASAITIRELQDRGEKEDIFRMRRDLQLQRRDIEKRVEQVRKYSRKTQQEQPTREEAGQLRKSVMSREGSSSALRQKRSQSQTRIAKRSRFDLMDFANGR